MEMPHQFGAIFVSVDAAPQYACRITAFERIKFCRVPAHFAGVSKNYSTPLFHGLLRAKQQIGARDLLAASAGALHRRKIPNCADNSCMRHVGVTQQYPRQ
jgi:hypothetical protein